MRSDYPIFGIGIILTLRAFLRILVADDDRSTRMLLRALLVRSGHTVIEAANGQEAIEAFDRQQPHLVIMDVTMPVMSGYDAATEIKRRGGSRRFIPIIFLTALNDDEALAKCLDSGGDDFLVKPFNAVLLQAKLRALQWTLDLYKKLEGYQDRTEEELVMAKHIFDTITGRVQAEVPGLRRWTKAAGHFPGDVILYDRTPSGRLFAMVGDFTGHGLAAAIGILPVADIFFAMTRKDRKATEIIAEINRKLYEILPTGHFCAAGFVVFNPIDGTLKVWNGGLPEILLVDENRHIVQRFPSTSFALGIVDSPLLALEMSVTQRTDAERLLVYTDGLTEAAGNNSEMFGQARLESAVESSAGHSILDTVQQAVTSHLNSNLPQDDISLLELPLNR